MTLIEILWRTSHTFSSLMSKLDTPLTLLARWNQNLAPLSHFLLFGISSRWPSHAFGFLEPKFGTPLTLVLRWNQNLTPLSHFCFFGIKNWRPSNTFGSLESKFGLSHVGLFRFKFTLLSHFWLLGIINWRPVTLLALRNRNLTPLSHFWFAGIKIWRPSHTLGSLKSKIGASLTPLALHASIRGWPPWVEDRPPCV